MRWGALALLLAAASAHAAEHFAVRLPFAEGTRFTISQGYDAARQRVPVDRRWIVGFSVPGKAEVVALHEGTVVEAGPLADGSARVVIEHPDGHLSYHMSLPGNAVTVRKGQAVQERQPIATADGVLHYALVTRFPDGVYVSQPVTFVNGPDLADVEAVTGTSGVVRYRAPEAPKPAVAAPLPTPDIAPLQQRNVSVAAPPPKPEEVHPLFLPLGFAVVSLVGVWGAWRSVRRTGAPRG